MATNFFINKTQGAAFSQRLKVLPFITINTFNTTMEKLQKSFVLFLFLICGMSLSAQDGNIRGTVFDSESGESLIAVTIAVQGTGMGTVSDLDGSFDLPIAAGTYNLEVSYISYQTITITDVEVKAGEVTLLDNIMMETASEITQEVVITAEVIRSSEAALMTIKRKSSTLVDGISSSRFKKIGDSNAGDAVKRVTGVSVEGGKYVFVRGLGDRYTKTILNNVDIPGLDPDRNSLQIDIFPTNLLNNMMVYKTAAADLPADFTGGLVNIETKDFPEEKTLDISLGLGFNPDMHFNSDYLTYEGGSTDWLGFDDGTRALPNRARNEVIPSPLSGRHNDADVNGFLNKFSPILGATTTTSMPDFSIGASFGDQKTLSNDHKIGYVLSGTYKSSRNFYSDATFGEYQLETESDQNALTRANSIIGSIGEENILVGGMAGLAYKTARTKHKINLIHLQNGESKAAQFSLDNNEEAAGQSGYTAISDNLEYSQRSLTNILLNGSYALDNDWKVEWNASSTISELTDPDIRKTAFTEDNDFQFAAGAGGFPSRRWRFLDEVNYVGKLDITKDYTLLGEDAKLKIGASYVNKERDYNILTYNMAFFGTQADWGADANNVLTQDNLFPNGSIYYQSGNNTPNPNQYNSTVNNTAFYISNEFNPLSSLKATVGLRAEKYVQRHTGRDQLAANGEPTGNSLDNEKVLDALDFFPSLNLIFSISDKQNVRASFSRTIARPSFKELSYASILDPITDRIFNGSLFEYRDRDGNILWDGNLVETRINNFDVRWEMFSEGGQLISLSTFYKTFADPIELVRIPQAQTSNEFQTRNVGDSKVYGVELEIRRNVPLRKNSLNLSSNITFVKSELTMSEVEYNSRKAFEKDNQTITRTRQMAGQAPFIINAGATFVHGEKPWDFGLYYNVKGRTLEITGGSLFPDVYSAPFHSLNFSANYALGKDDKIKLGLNIDNLLNSRRESIYNAFDAPDEIFSRLYPGTTFGISLGYSIY